MKNKTGTILIYVGILLMLFGAVSMFNSYGYFGKHLDFDYHARYDDYGNKSYSVNARIWENGDIINSNCAYYLTKKQLDSVRQYELNVLKQLNK